MQFVCFIDVGSGRTHFNLSRLYEDEYVLITVVELDREQCVSYDVSVTCTDRGEDHQVSTRAIHVEITDENDNSPVFAVNRLNLTVVENNDIDCWLKDVSATDLTLDSTLSLLTITWNGRRQSLCDDQQGDRSSYSGCDVQSSGDDETEFRRRCRRPRSTRRGVTDFE